MRAVRVRHVSILAAVVAMAAVLVPAGIAGSRAAGAPVLPTLYVVYTMNCTFSIVDDSGKPVSAIAPGTYQVEVSTPIMFKLVNPGGPGVDPIASNDFTGCKGWVQFQLTGPGVNLSTTLDSGCDAFYLLPSTSFKPGATYTAQDLNQPSVTRTSFTILTSGTPTIPKSPYGPTSGKGTTQQDLAGSGIKAALKGTLTGTLSADGKPTLTSKGKPVSVLKRGRYRFTITDKDPKGSFVLQAVNPGSTGVKATDLSALTFVGKHSTYVTLSAGRWMYYSDPGKAYNFLVTG